MGLDNGFTVKNLKKEDIPSFVKAIPYKDTFDFGYMRKCWNIRDELCSLYHMTNDVFEYKLEEEDFNATLRVLKTFLYADKFDEDRGIWTFEEYGDNLVDNYIALSWLFEYIKSGHHDIEVVFYDSY